jgi:hypothetical protein
MFRHKLALAMAVLLLVLVAIGAGNANRTEAFDNTPEAAVKTFFDDVRAHDWDAAYAMLSPSSNLDKGTFIREMEGTEASLKTLSTLQHANTKVLERNDNEAKVHTDLQWSTAVGAENETRDLTLVKESAGWRVVWRTTSQPSLQASAVETNFLRWDIVQSRGNDASDEWGGQNIESPRMDIVSMNAVERDGAVTVMGEVVNLDTVPGFINVSADLIGKDGKVMGSETSFDKISHTLLPKEVSPFRIDFPNTKLANVKSVRLDPNTLLVPAFADPTIGVLHQRIEKDANGHTVLRGELVNEGGKPVNIPHVIATYYDSVGRVIWVSDGYVDQALMPQKPVPFSVPVRDDLTGAVHSYRVSVNHYDTDKG